MIFIALNVFITDMEETDYVTLALIRKQCLYVT
jgi:hypothetical protein